MIQAKNDINMDGDGDRKFLCFTFQIKVSRPKTVRRNFSRTGMHFYNGTDNFQACRKLLFIAGLEETKTWIR
ncbi:hypothetical protein H8L32_26230 [Undibacterium sp. CY18W]|uniref:Uncharacterized protein n=1 Tax=Undibacterium hunanense TaxID=2762292 RepID=A0ABR6ZYS9_9BURK|nr:hypothetical protein [Undibacterium hunanense]MBC3920989.1 hypothetical protein [Undibacterium hunanense]